MKNMPQPSDSNGGRQGGIDSGPSGPPWSNVDPWAIIRGLECQLGAQATEMAAMRQYIAQLHEALQQVTDMASLGATGTPDVVPAENTSPTP